MKKIWQPCKQTVTRSSNIIFHNLPNLYLSAIDHENWVMNRSRITGIIATLAGAFCIYWAGAHSPKASFFKQLGREMNGSYTMSENWYYITLAAGSLLVLWGLLRLFRILK